MLKFVKYLVRDRWDVFVLASSKLLYPRVEDPQLLAEVQPRVRVTRCYDSTLWFGFLDRTGILAKDELKALSWIVFALRKGIMTAKDSDVIFATAPPWSNHILAYLLCRICGKPLVLDYRDPITFTPLAPPDSIYHKITYPLEVVLIKAAKTITCTSKRLRLDLVRNFNVDAAKVVSIYTGFDPDDFAPIPAHSRSSQETSGRMTIFYAGTLGKGHDPRLFLLGLKKFLEARSEAQRRVLTIFAGIDLLGIEEEVNEMKLSDVVDHVGFLSRRDALALLGKSDVLLLLLTPRDHQKSTFERLLYGLPLKTFDYVGARNHMLAVIPEGSEVADIIEACNGTVVTIPKPGSSPNRSIDEEVVSKIADEMGTLYDRWVSDKLRENEGDATAFSVVETARILSRTLGALI